MGKERCLKNISQKSISKWQINVWNHESLGRSKRRPHGAMPCWRAEVTTGGRGCALRPCWRAEGRAASGRGRALTLRQVWHSRCQGELGGSSVLCGPTTANQLSQTWVQVKQKRTSTQTCTQLFKKPKCASGAEWVKKPWWTHTMKHNLTIRNRLLVITTWNQANRLKWAGKNCIFKKFHLCTILSNVQ